MPYGDKPPMPVSFVWDEVQPRPDGVDELEYPVTPDTVYTREPDPNADLRRYVIRFDRRRTMGQKIARFLRDLAFKVEGWH